MSLVGALAIAAAVVLVAALAGILLRSRDGRRSSAPELRVAAEDIAPAAFAPVATLVQFSTEVCARCPQVRRMLRDVADGYEQVEHAEIDLTHRPDLATRYGVLQTPTVFVVDDAGEVRARFHGVPPRAAITLALAEFPVLAPEHR